MTRVAILILAAGASSRMQGRDKLLEQVQGAPLLARVAGAAVATGAPVIVVLPPDRPDRARALAGLDVALVEAAEARQGMSASLRRGMQAVMALDPAADGVMILPADMPGLQAGDLERVIAAFRADPGRIVRGATEDGRQGHPALFPADLFRDLLALTGDEGGRSVLRAQAGRLALVVLPGESAVLDLDTPEDWAAFRASGRQ